MTRRLRLAAGLLVAMLVVSGCGDGGADSQTEDETKFTTEPAGS